MKLNQKSISTALFAVILMLSVSPMNGQGKVTLTGQVKDQQTSEPLEFCNVSYYDMKDSLITGTATDQRGFYTMLLPMGQYKQVISYIGNQADTTIVLAIEDKFLGESYLEPDAALLGDATVTASAHRSEVDRDVQVVTKEMREGTFAAKYVLDKLNGVHYDEYSDAIKVDNDDRVIILVDGVQKDQEYVKNLEPERLKKVEVIRDPSGRYGLEGYSAVINIILDRNYRGVEVLAQNRGLYDPDAGKAEYIPVQNRTSATVTYTYNKYSIYARGAHTSNSYNMDTYESKEYRSGLRLEKVPAFDDAATLQVSQVSNEFTLGADYFINPKHTLSFEGKMIRFPEERNLVNVFQVINSYQNDILVDSYDSDVAVRSTSSTAYGSAFYEGKLNDRNNLKSNLVYSRYENFQDVSYLEQQGNMFDQQGTDNKQNLNYYLEYSHTFGDGSNGLLGYGNTLEDLSSTFRSEIEDNDFSTREFRTKAYAYYTRTLTPKLSINMGGAAEWSARQVDDRTDNYSILLPHLDFKVDLTKSSNLKFKWRAEGNYPTINQTNPFTTFVDLESVQTGNPNLEPEVTNRASVQASFLNGAITLEPYYHFSDNMIIMTGELRPDNIFAFTYDNAGSYTNYGMKAGMTMPLGKILFLQSGVDLYKSAITYESYSNDVSDWSMSSQLIYRHQKSNTIAGIGYQKNNNKRILAQGYRNQNVDFWMVLVRRPFFKEKLSVMLVYFPPVTWGVNDAQGTFINTDAYTEEEFTSMDFFKNMVMVTLSYRFNKGKVLKKEKDEVDYIRERENKGMF